MKSYTITVNGNVYDVTVEENGSVAAPAAAPRRAAAPVAAPAAPKAAAPATGAGSIKIEAGAAGKVFKVEKQAGAAVKRGEAIVILEVMKMETLVVAPQDGTVASVNVSVGDMVEAGALLATMN
ncbi:MAG: biotin/lipoyl-binding protein [Lachnospiraceae bacterium]|nr:biotin/lipoyl-binding protein [Lachnospiraceae bacterium]